jgi:hypothetical protein
MHYKTIATAKQLQITCNEAPVRQPGRTDVDSPVKKILRLQKTMGNRAVSRSLNVQRQTTSAQQPRGSGGPCNQAHSQTISSAVRQASS